VGGGMSRAPYRAAVYVRQEWNGHRIGCGLSWRDPRGNVCRAYVRGEWCRAVAKEARELLAVEGVTVTSWSQGAIS
jgi:hypothetical protein